MKILHHCRHQFFGCYLTWTWVSLIVFASPPITYYYHPETSIRSHSRDQHKRELMVVLPVTQGHYDAKDPRLQFWYTKPPVTIMLEDGLPKSTTPSQPHKKKMTTTTTAPVIYEKNVPTAKPLSPVPTNAIKFILNRSSNNSYSMSPKHQKSDVIVISAQSKWKTNTNSKIQTEKSDLKLKEKDEKATILPSSTHRFHSVSSLPTTGSKGETNNNNDKQRTQFLTRIKDPAKVYETLKESPLKQLFPIKVNQSQHNLWDTNFDVFKLVETTDNNITTDTNTAIPADLANINMIDFQSMLQDLGILLSKDNEIKAVSTTTESENNVENFPIDPISYSSFKRFPQPQPENSLPKVNRDIESILASYGLLPTKTIINQTTNSTSVRITRDIGDNLSPVEKVKDNDNLIINLAPQFGEHNKAIKTSQEKINNSVAQKTSTIMKNKKQIIPRPRIGNLMQILFGTPSLAHTKMKVSKDVKKNNKNLVKNDIEMNIDGIQNHTASIRQLEESFGGENPENSVGVESSSKPNGMYFYVDWNKFLNVAEQGGQKPVKVKFSPKAGDSKMFLPITFP